MARTPNDDRSDGMNPNNPAQWANEANHLNQVGSGDDHWCGSVKAAADFWRPLEPVFAAPFPEKPIKNVFVLRLKTDGRHASQIGNNVKTFDLDEVKKGAEELWRERTDLLYLCFLHETSCLAVYRRREMPSYAIGSLAETERFAALIRGSSNCSSAFYSHVRNIPTTVTMQQLLDAK